jgi:hypothetical protein
MFLTISGRQEDRREIQDSTQIRQAGSDLHCEVRITIIIHFYKFILKYSLKKIGLFINELYLIC